ncbi:hypothetical protein Plhal703r1_c08g0045741 [Plasmopara halstedii]
MRVARKKRSVVCFEQNSLFELFQAGRRRRLSGSLYIFYLKIFRRGDDDQEPAVSVLSNKLDPAVLSSVKGLPGGNEYTQRFVVKL